MKDRKGDWMQTYSGRKFWPLDPHPEDIHLEDIAHALSMVCRFNEPNNLFEHKLLCLSSKKKKQNRCL